MFLALNLLDVANLDAEFSAAIIQPDDESLRRGSLAVYIRRGGADHHAFLAIEVRAFEQTDDQDPAVVTPRDNNNNTSCARLKAKATVARYVF